MAEEVIMICSYSECGREAATRGLCKTHYMREWRAKNPDRVKAIKDAYAARNRGREAARAKAWYEANKDRAAETSKAWQAANPIKVDSYKQRSRARKQTTGPMDEDISRQAVGDRDGWICGICEKPVDPARSSIDHVVPLSHGGTHTWSNVQISHPGCNSQKKDRVLAGATTSSEGI